MFSQALVDTIIDAWMDTINELLPPDLRHEVFHGSVARAAELSEVRGLDMEMDVYTNSPAIDFEKEEGAHAGWGS